MRLRAAWRASAIAMAVVWMLVPALAAVHGVETEHNYCAEHEAFEHGDLAVAAGDDTSGTTATDGTPVSEQHEACAFSNLLRRDLSDSSTGDVAVAAAVSAPADQPWIDQTDRRQLPVLASAPKASPPA
jgi:hypothetical protein